MRDSYTPGNYVQAEADQAAALSYACGVSFAMIYGTGSSGTYSDSAVVSLKSHFGFPNAQLLDRSSFYDDESWMQIIFDELSHNRPVMYSGSDDLWTVGGEDMPLSSTVTTMKDSCMSIGDGLVATTVIMRWTCSIHASTVSIIRKI